MSDHPSAYDTVQKIPDSSVLVMKPRAHGRTVVPVRPPTSARIYMYPADVLKEHCTPVRIVKGEEGVRIDAPLREIMSALRDSVSVLGRQALAIAAPQVGIAKRAFIVDADELKIDQAVFINPSIELGDERKPMWEACMSMPDGVKVAVMRAERVTIHATDLNGEDFSIEVEGLAAQVMQHEMDHLNGITIWQHASPKSRKRMMRQIALALQRRVR